VLPKYCTNLWLTCILSTPKSKKIMKSHKCYQLSKTWNRLEIYTTKGFDSIATILPILKSRQGVLLSGLQTFPYHLGDMHNLASKKICHLKTDSWSFVCTLETNTSRAQDFLQICTLVEKAMRNTLSFASVV
jgi:hypothetical protein